MISRVHRDEIKRQQRSRNRKRSLNEVEIERIHHSTFNDWYQSHVSLISFIYKLNFFSLNSCYLTNK